MLVGMLHKCFLVEQNNKTVHPARPNFTAEGAQTYTTAVTMEKKQKQTRKNQPPSQVEK